MKSQVPKRTKSHSATPSHSHRPATTPKRQTHHHAAKNTNIGLTNTNLFAAAGPVSYTLPSLSYSNEHHQSASLSGSQSSGTSLTSTKSTPIDLSQHFDVTQTVHNRPSSRHTRRQSTSLTSSHTQSQQQQQRRHYRVNPPKGFHESLYGNSLPTKNIVSFQEQFDKDTKANLRRFGVKPDEVDESNIMVVVGEAIPSGVKTGSNAMTFEQFLIHSRNMPLSITNISPAQLKDKRILLRSDLDLQYETIASENAEGDNTNSNSTNEVKVTESGIKQLQNLVPTLQYLIDSGAQVILSSSKPQRRKALSAEGEIFDGFQPVAKALSDLLNKQITFVKKPLENDAQSMKKVLSLPQSTNEIILLDNLSMEQLESPTTTTTTTPTKPHQQRISNDLSDQILDIIEPALCVYDMMPLKDNDPSLSQLPQHAKKRSIPSVVGMLAAKELNETNELYKALQHISDEGLALQASILAQQKTHGNKKLQKSALTPHQYTTDLGELGQDNAKLGQTFTKTLLMGSESFNELIPALRSSFETTQNFIFSNKSSFGLAHATHITETALVTREEVIYREMLELKPPTPFSDEVSKDISPSLAFLANAAKSGKSVWLPHDWSLSNPSNPESRKISASTIQLYEAGFKSLRVEDIGVSTRKDFRWAVDNIIAQQLEGKNQLIFWFGSMSPLSTSSSSDGNDAIIEALDKATSAGVITVVGGNEVLEAIDRYNNNAPQKAPQFSFITSSPAAVSAVLAGESVFGDFEQARY